MSGAEEWVSVPDNAGYEVSTLGRVRSLDRQVARQNGRTQFWAGRMLALLSSRSGRNTVKIGPQRRNVDYLVLEAFVGSRPDGHDARHIDCNPSNDALTNLEWSDYSESALPDSVTPDEEWRPIPSRPGYEASSAGRVRSLDRIVVHQRGQFRLRGRVLSLHRHDNGYLQVVTGSELGTGWVHRLVLEAFVGPCPDGMEACHGPGGQADNRLSNLRWGTPSSNNADTVRAGRHAGTKRTHCPARHALRQPNLVRSELPNRKCRACARAHARMAALRRAGVEGDFQAIADFQYGRIMNEAEVAA